MKRVLITGGAGFIGSALARRLCADHEVVAFDDFSRGKTERLNESIITMHGDIRDRQGLESAMRGCDAIFHLAYVQGTQTFYEQPQRVVDVAFDGILNVLRAAEHQGDKELFLVSSSEAYQIPPEGMTPTNETVPLSVPDVTNPRYSYGGGKIASEIAAFSYADVLKRLVVIRPHNIYGPDMGNEHVIPEFAARMKTIAAGTGHPIPPDFPIQGTGQETRCFCHINDCIDAFEILLDELPQLSHREVFHVGNPEEVTIETLARKVADHWGMHIDVIPGTLPKGSPPRRVPDIGKLRKLDYSPKVTLDEGLQGTLRWYANHA